MSFFEILTIFIFGVDIYINFNLTYDDDKENLIVDRYVILYSYL